MSAYMPKTKNLLKNLVFMKQNNYTSKNSHLLATDENVMKHYLWVQFNLKSDSWNLKRTVLEISKAIVDKKIYV